MLSPVTAYYPAFVWPVSSGPACSAIVLLARGWAVADTGQNPARNVTKLLKTIVAVAEPEFVEVRCKVRS